MLAARRRHAAGENLTAIAADLGVAPVTVWRAVVRKTYANIKR
ncbi:hypothetical protein [Falsiroseomonas sp. E2-1-a20]